MVTIDIETKGLEEMQKRFAELSKSLPQHLQAFANEKKHSIETEMQVEYLKSGLQTKTGGLRDSAYAAVFPLENGVEIKMGFGSSIASYMELGTPPHKIYGNPVLHWEDNEGDHFAAWVNHPGTPPHHFLSNATTTSNNMLLGQLPNYLRRWMQSQQ